MEGTLTKIIDNINSIWPVTEDTIIVEDFCNGTAIKIIGHQNFTFEIELDQYKFISQPVVICAFRSIILHVVCNKRKKAPIDFYIDGKEVKPFNKCKEKLAIAMPPTSYCVNKNTVDVVSDITCRKWRSDLFHTGTGLTQNNRVQKSKIEQVNELRLSIFSLKEHQKNFSCHQDLFLFNTLPILRSLIYWRTENSKNYNPLLFRLAGSLDIELNMYALSDESYKEYKQIGLGDPTFAHLEYVSFNKMSDAQTLIDFQDWLNKDAIFGESNYKNKDIILYAANTMSFAHFDPDTHVILKDLKEKKTLNTSMLVEMVNRVVELTIHFGNKILDVLEKE
ncbi:hypothetical protein [Mangrovibacterium sp.]|uniref:hypothetical protein n=1 Tax=Mangrovibacterium sp. TaxID=1961364 RepID=UPI0035687004